MRLRVRFALALVAGALQVAAFAPLNLWGLQPLSLAALVALAQGQGPRASAALGFNYGLGWFGAGMWWLYISLHDFGGLAPPLAVAALLLLFAFLSLYPALALWIWARLRAPGWTAAPLFAAAWLAGELARAQFFTGFPWIAGGYAHTVGLLAPWATWIGVYGLGAMAAWLGAGLALREPRALAPPLALVALGGLLPQDFTESSGTLRLSLLQPAVPQEQKFDPARIERNLDSLLGQIERAGGELVVAPESVLPLPFEELPAAGRDRVAALSQEHALLLGTFTGSQQEGWVNSMVGWQRGEPVYQYGKRHLLPFGEFVPPGLHWFVRALQIPMDDQATGAHQRPWVLGGQRLRPLICYEDLFGEDFVAGALDGPDAATVFINTSNLAWFGRRLILDQHLQFSQMRALEFQRPVVRSTNTGATAWIDHRGRVRERLEPETAGLLTVSVEGRRGVTPYARWLGACGLWPLWVLALLPLAWVARRRRAFTPQ